MSLPSFTLLMRGSLLVVVPDLLAGCEVNGSLHIKSCDVKYFQNAGSLCEPRAWPGAFKRALYKNRKFKYSEK
jgi:hypothetical protein